MSNGKEQSKQILGFTHYPLPITGQGSAFAQHFFDVNVTTAQRQANGSCDGVKNCQTSFVEGKHGVFGPTPYFGSLPCLTKVLGER
jgi:hypothetical protein